MIDDNKDYRKVILDTSVLIGLLSGEESSDTIKELIPKAVMSSVSIAEAGKYLIDKKSITKEHFKMLVERLISEVIPFTVEQAYVSAELAKELSNIKDHNLLFQDFAMIALARITHFPIYTFNPKWKNFNIENIEIKFL